MSVVSFSEVRKIYRDRKHPKLINGCVHRVFVENSYNLVCSACGYVIEERKYKNVSHRVYSYDEAMEFSHTNIKELKFNENRTTFRAKDIFGNDNYKKFENLRRKDSWTNNRRFARMKEAKHTISQGLKHLGFLGNRVLNSHIDYILRKTGNYKLQGKSIKLYSAAILVYCLRLCGITEKVKTIFSFYGIKKKMSLFNTMMELIETYGLLKVDRSTLYTNVTRYLNELIDLYGIDCNISDYITELQDCVIILESNGGGRSKTCNTSGIIYYLFKKYNFRPTQKQVADYIGVSTVSLRNSYNVLLDYEID